MQVGKKGVEEKGKMWKRRDEVAQKEYGKRERERRSEKQLSGRQ